MQFNPVLIVLPILLLLMYTLGLEFKLKDVVLLAKRPKALLIGLLAQVVILPVVAILLAKMFNPAPYLFVGIVLIACSPGGSSSNMLSYIAKGDVALSVTLTSLSSIITIFTIPPVLIYAIQASGYGALEHIQLPVGKLFVQNIVLLLLPIALGMLTQKFLPVFAQKAKKVLDKMAFPALLILAVIFYIANKDIIIANFGQLAIIITLLIIAAMVLGVALGYIGRLSGAHRRTIAIEVGIQNAAQAIAIASSPFILNDNSIAVPAIIYALMMNVILLSYISKYIFKKKQTD